MDNKEINRQIASKIMKWEQEEYVNLWRDEKGYLYATGYPLPNLPYKFFNPVENIADVWQVVEKLKDKKLHGRVDAGFTLDYDSYHKIWRAEFGWTFASAYTASEAICLAALEVVKD